MQLGKAAHELQYMVLAAQAMQDDLLLSEVVAVALSMRFGLEGRRISTDTTVPSSTARSYATVRDHYQRAAERNALPLRSSWLSNPETKREKPCVKLWDDGTK